MDGRTPEEIRADTCADQNGSYFLARGGEDELFESTLPTLQEKRTLRPTGRHTVEPGGGDMSRIEANRDNRENPMSDDERTRVKRGMGHMSFQIEKSRIAYEKMMSDTEGDPQARAVALRNLADGRK